jgi:hypothetical protein
MSLPRPVFLRWAVKDPNIEEYRIHAVHIGFNSSMVPVLDDEISAAAITSGGEAQYMLPINIVASGGYIRVDVYARTGKACSFSVVGGATALFIN